MRKDKCDVVIVGGGLGGLSTAALLGRSGLRVTVLDRAKGVGGRAATNERGGYFFNQGAHAFYKGGAAARVLRGLGIVPVGRQPAAGGIAVAFGKAHILPATLGSMLTTALLSFSAKVQGAKLFARLGSYDTKKLANVTWTEFVAREVPDPSMRAALEAFVRVATYANAPDLVSAGATIDQLRIAQNPGVLYVDEGWQTITNAVAKTATDVSVTIRTSARVEHAHREDGEWCVTTEDGETFRCTSLVLATGPLTAKSIVASQALEAAAARATPAHIACLDVALERLPNPKATFALGVDQPTYFSVHSKSCRVAPPGAAFVSTMKYLEPGAPHDARADRAELETMLDLLQPGWRPLLVDEQWLPSMIATNALRLAKNCDRISSQIPDTSGLFVVGDWVGDEGMLLDAALASAESAANQIVRTSAVAKVA